MMLVIAGGMALLLGVGGIYGVISYSVSQRTREIGIRIALGAQARSVTRMFVSHGLMLAGVGVAIGLTAAFAIMRLMSSLLFEVSPVDPVTYAHGLAHADARDRARQLCAGVTRNRGASAGIAQNGIVERPIRRPERLFRHVARPFQGRVLCARPEGRADLRACLTGTPNAVACFATKPGRLSRFQPNLRIPWYKEEPMRSHILRISIPLALSGLLVAATAGAAQTDVCVTIDQARDTFSPEDRTAALLLVTRQFELAGERVVPGECSTPYTLAHVRLGNTITVTLSGPGVFGKGPPLAWMTCPRSTVKWFDRWSPDSP